ncbi:mitochondrial inner membrane protease Atp23p [Trichomonascus vanleenenianus]|uniref:putative metalloprotease n=1 Tax=Trichomonascus vanleenenianus TaxID=2268995 RepID=UPI003EC9A66F
MDKNSGEDAERALHGFKWFLRMLPYRTGIGLTEEAQKQMEEDIPKRLREIECRRCEENKKWVLQYSPIVRFMSEQIHKVGGNINEKTVVCGHCDEFKAGGFNPELGIMLCQNRVMNRLKFEDTLAHEMVHAYDHCKFNVDWSDLRHHACSEIRASALSGECRAMNQIVRNGIFKFAKGHQACVKRRATLSVLANPNCKDDVMAAKVVNEVFDSCYNDTRPFDEIYR